MNTKRETAKRLFYSAISESTSMSAYQLAYSLLMGFIPLLMFVVTLAGRLDLPVTDIYSSLRFMLPSDAYSIVESIINEIAASQSWTFYTLISALYFVSTGMSRIVSISSRASGKKELGFIAHWATAFIIGSLLCLSILVSIGLIIFGDYLARWVANHTILHLSWIITVSRYLMAYAITVSIFTIIYFLAAHNRISQIKEALAGAACAAAIWIASSAAFAFYVNNFSNYGIIFGSLGGVFVLLVWLYLTSYILILGIFINEEFNHLAT
ncbi:MAG: YihY family inner membrane protein [Eubacteriaceae bacterium]|nr:YihY family inner membrane protein [Eubacteriaceae bacterium]